jgi:phospholipid N-methyltransferase
MGPAALGYPPAVGLTERIAFLTQFRRQLVTTGAVQPSSRFLAREMTAPLRRARLAAPAVRRRIVEMGPGTGAVTAAIAAAMGPEDRLDCYEINPEFAEYLRERIAADHAFGAGRERIVVHCAAAQEAEPGEPVDFVVCSVPLNNLPPDAVESIFERGFELLAGGGWFTYFEYPVLPRIKRLFCSPAERERIDGVTAVKERRSSTGAASAVILRNIPPARAVHLRVGDPARKG